MANQATYDDANLILRLYELRREEKLRKARDWFSQNFAPASAEDMLKLAAPGTEGNTYLRMVTGYWEMVASFVTSGVLNQELFFESGGEMMFVWERMKDMVPIIRQTFKNPLAFKNLEAVGNAYIKRMQAASPETYPAFQAMVKGVGRG